MKIVTWNVNSVNARKNLLFKLINEHKPEVICLQETKVINRSFPQKEFEELGYNCYLNGVPSYNGVAILSKSEAKNFKVHDYCKKNDGRHIETDVCGLKVHSIYVPAGGDEPNVEVNPKFKHKMEFIKKLALLSKRLRSEQLVFCGDLNVAPYKDDVWSHNQLKNVVSHTELERNALLKVMSSGDFFDVIRKFINPPDNVYTWWSYRSPDYSVNNRGRRLDHIWASNGISDRVHSAKILESFRSDLKPSDHVPVFIEIDRSK